MRANWSRTFGLWMRRLVCACIGHKWNIPWDAWEQVANGKMKYTDAIGGCERCGEKVTP